MLHTTLNVMQELGGLQLKGANLDCTDELFPMLELVSPLLAVRLCLSPDMASGPCNATCRAMDMGVCHVARFDVLRYYSIMWVRHFPKP